MEEKSDFYKLLSNCEDELICFVCEEWCRPPIKLNKCGHYLCEKCIPTVDQSCPKCKEVFFLEDVQADNRYTSIRQDIEFFRTCVDFLFGDSNAHIRSRDCEKFSGLPFEIVFADSKSFKKNAKGESRLHLACKRKNVLEVRKLIEGKVDINCKDYACWTPLHEAIQAESVEIVTELLSHRVLINAPGEFYVTPLHKAVLMENTAIIKLLVQNGANKEAVDFYGRKPADLTKKHCLLEALNQTKVNTSIYKPCVFLSNKIVAYCHSIDDKYKEKISNSKNVRVVAEFNIDNQELTHLVVKTSHKVSFKILLSLLRGLLIVGQEWIHDFIVGEVNILNELILQKELKLSQGIQRALISHLSNQPKLFDGMRFYLELPDVICEVYGLHLQKDILKLLISTGGGEMLTRAPAPRVIDENNQFPYHASQCSTVYGCCSIIIFDEKHPPKLQYHMKELQHKSCRWLLDCIINYELV